MYPHGPAIRIDIHQLCCEICVRDIRGDIQDYAHGTSDFQLLRQYFRTVHQHVRSCLCCTLIHRTATQPSVAARPAVRTTQGGHGIGGIVHKAIRRFILGTLRGEISNSSRGMRSSFAVQEKLGGHRSRWRPFTLKAPPVPAHNKYPDRRLRGQPGVYVFQVKIQPPEGLDLLQFIERSNLVSKV